MLKVEWRLRNWQSWTTGVPPITPSGTCRSTSARAGAVKSPTAPPLPSGTKKNGWRYSTFGDAQSRDYTDSFVVNPLAPVQETVCLLQNETTGSSSTVSPQKSVSTYYMIKLNIRSGKRILSLSFSSFSFFSFASLGHLSATKTKPIVVLIVAGRQWKVCVCE